MGCPYLEYRRESDDLAFDHERAYCTAADRFVQPMRADICNDRYDLVHSDHCEIYREHADEPGEAEAVDGAAGAGGTESVDRAGDPDE